MFARRSAQREGRGAASLAKKILHCKGWVELISSSRLSVFARNSAAYRAGGNAE
jgi:hypothetical protein